jgi:hypothetical protein
VRPRDEPDHVGALQERSLADPAQREEPGGEPQGQPGRGPFGGWDGGEHVRLGAQSLPRPLGLDDARVPFLRHVPVRLEQRVQRRLLDAPRVRGQLALGRAVVAVPAEEGVQGQPVAGDLPEVGDHRGLRHRAVAGHQGGLGAGAAGGRRRCPDLLVEPLADQRSEGVRAHHGLEPPYRLADQRLAGREIRRRRTGHDLVPPRRDRRGGHPEPAVDPRGRVRGLHRDDRIP